MTIDCTSAMLALIGLTQALARALTPRYIRVKAVVPGPVRTPSHLSDGPPTGQLNGFGDGSWLGRRWSRRPNAYP